jgi:hypothetical protein
MQFAMRYSESKKYKEHISVLSASVHQNSYGEVLEELAVVGLFKKVHTGS